MSPFSFVCLLLRFYDDLNWSNVSRFSRSFVYCLDSNICLVSQIEVTVQCMGFFPLLFILFNRAKRDTFGFDQTIVYGLVSDIFFFQRINKFKGLKHN